MTKTKPDFTAKEPKATKTAPASFIGAANTTNTNDTQSIKGRPATTDTEAKADDYRFNARFTALQGKYIQEKAWQTRKSITATLQNIIEEDMEKHPDIVKAIDELNG